LRLCAFASLRFAFCVKICETEGIVGLYRLTIHPLVQLIKTSWKLSKQLCKALHESPIKATYSNIQERLLALYAKIEAKVTKRLKKIQSLITALAEPFLWAGRELWLLLKPLWKPIQDLFQ
jgi:hypothetical protein